MPDRDPRLNPLLKRKQDLKKKRRETRAALGDVQKKIEDIHRERGKLDERGTGCIDGCSMPLGLKLFLLDCRQNGGWTGTVNAADRTDHADDCSDKSSQLELWNAYQNGTGAPANPPGTSSHEYKNGGTSRYGTGNPAYATKFKVGATLPWWALGLDVTDAEGLIAAAKKLGYPAVFRPFNPPEPWHCQLADSPQKRLIERGRV